MINPQQSLTSRICGRIVAPATMLLPADVFYAACQFLFEGISVAIPGPVRLPAIGPEFAA